MDSAEHESQGETGTDIVTLTLTEDEREVIELALGELFISARRGENLVPIIRSVLEKVRAASTRSDESEAS
jgi:hypothetical protein